MNRGALPRRSHGLLFSELRRTPANADGTQEMEWNAEYAEQRNVGMLEAGEELTDEQLEETLVRPETPLHSLGPVEDAEPQVLIEVLLSKDPHFKFLDDLLKNAHQEAVDTDKPQAMLMSQEGGLVYPVPISAFQWDFRDLVHLLTKKAPQTYQLLFERGQQAFNDARNSGTDQYLRITPSGATFRAQAPQPQPQPQHQPQARSQQEHQQRQNRAQEMLRGQFQSVHGSLENPGIANPSGYRNTAAAGMTVVSGVDLVAKIIEVPTAEESAAASAAVVPINVVPRRMGPGYKNTDFDPNLPGGVYENAWMLKPASERFSQAHSHQKQDQSPISTWYKLYLIAYRAAYLCFYPPGAIPQTFVTVTVPYGNDESVSVVIRMPPNRKPGEKFFLVPTTVKVPSGAVPGKWCLVPDLNGVTQPVLLPRYARPSDYVHSMVPRTFDETKRLDVHFGGGHAVLKHVPTSPAISQQPITATQLTDRQHDTVSQTFKIEVPAACREGDHVYFTLMDDDQKLEIQQVVTIPSGGKPGVLIDVTIALPGHISTRGLSVVRTWKMGNREPSLSSRRRRAAPAPVPRSS